YFSQFVKAVWSRPADSSDREVDVAKQVDVPLVARLVRPCLPDPAFGSLPLAEVPDLDFQPTWRDLPYSEKLVEPLHDAEFDGGEEKVGTQNVHDNGYRFPE
ncbi:cry, partial [Symbiodinium pilosum]